MCSVNHGMIFSWHMFVKCVFCLAAIQLFKQKMKKPCTKVSSKNVMKTLPKGKGTLPKGSKGKGALSKGSKGKGALAKGSKEKSPKKKNTKKNLEKMGEVSLKERVGMATKGSWRGLSKVEGFNDWERKTISLGEAPDLFEIQSWRKGKMTSCPKGTKGWQPHCGCSKRSIPPSSLWCPKWAPAKPWQKVMYGSLRRQCWTDLEKMNSKSTWIQEGSGGGRINWVKVCSITMIKEKNKSQHWQWVDTGSGVPSWGGGWRKICQTAREGFA